MLALHEKYKTYPPSIAQEAIRLHGARYLDPTTVEGAKLYKLQLELELKKCLEHAATLKRAGVRFVAVDYAGALEPLRRIHEAGSDKPADCVIAKPASTLISKLHERGLTHMPNLLVPRPRRLDAEPGKFERTTKIKLDPVAERALVTLSFDAGIPQFDANCQLEA